MAGAGGYFADPSEDTRPAAIRVLRVLLWADFALTAFMVVAGLLAAGISVPVLAHLAVMSWPGTVAGATAWRLGHLRRPHIAWPLAAVAWQTVMAISELLGGDPRGLTSLLLPLTIAVLLLTPPVRTYLRRPAPASYGDAGASAIEYAAVITLAALILGGLVALGVPAQVGTNTESALCRILTTRSCGPNSGSPNGESPNGGNPNAAPKGGNPNAPNGGNPNAPNGESPNVAPNGGNPNGESPNGGKPVAESCQGVVGCVWQAVRTDPHELARRVPCTGIVSCVVHGAAEAASSQYNVDKAILEDAKGIVDLATHPGSLVDTAKYVYDHPGDALRQMVWDDESTKLWNHGNYIGALSRGAWNIGSWLIPGGQIGKGLSKLGKYGKLGKLTDKAGKLGRLARSAREAGKAADRTKRLAAKGDHEGARKAAANARRKAHEAEREARKKGCKIVSLGALPLHFGGRSGLVAEGDPSCRVTADAERSAEKATESVWARTMDDPSSLRGMNPDEVEKMIPKTWTPSSARKHGGTRYADPKNGGDQVVVEGPIPGYEPPNIHAGKYIKVSRKGKIERIPLEGNPAL